MSDDNVAPFPRSHQRLEDAPFPPELETLDAQSRRYLALAQTVIDDMAAQVATDATALLVRARQVVANPATDPGVREAIRPALPTLERLVQAVEGVRSRRL